MILQDEKLQSLLIKITNKHVYGGYVANLVFDK